ncbi:MAG: T9SS type A sorting domain-containing protein, partial [Bacteroidales bacterium]|nr:T9SS type A sorting domain-containing protein [Bacteroidales bacterium]
ISVTATNSCGTSAARTLSVSVTTVPAQPGTLSGTTSLCQGSAETYSVTPVSGATSYTWTLPSGWIGNSTSASINVIASANGGTISITANNTCGSGTVRTLNVSISETPSAPVIGTISQPTCAVATGSVILSGLPSSGTWTITRSPGGALYSSTGTSYTVTGLAAGTYTFSVSNASGCSSGSSADAVIESNPATPSAPTVGTITQPTCDESTGSVVLNGLPSTGSWTLESNPGETISGTGTSISLSEITSGTYNFAVTNESGCISEASADVVINAQPEIPATPAVGFITQPTCAIATGDVVLEGLPSTGDWTITIAPGGTTKTGTGTTTTVSDLSEGTFNFTVTNESGCVSAISADVIIDAQPETPATPTITQSANILYSDAIAGNQWYDENGIINGATGQEYIPASAGNYYVIVTNDENCSSEPSNIINYVPTGIVKSELSKIIKLYPNPTDGKVRLSLAGENSHKISVEVLDILGQTLEIDKVELPDNQIEINLKGLSGGTYLVKITFSGNTLIEKVILR